MRVSERARQEVGLYYNHGHNQLTLFAELARVSAAEDAESVVAAVTEELREPFFDWIRGMPEGAELDWVGGPMPHGVFSKLKAWLAEHDASSRGE